MPNETLHTRLPVHEADQLAAHLSHDDPEWTYRPTRCADGLYLIEVYDESGTFIGYL